MRLKRLWGAMGRQSYLIHPGRSLPHRLPSRRMLGGMWAHIRAEGSHTGRHRHTLVHRLCRDKHTGQQTDMHRQTAKRIKAK